MDTEELERVKRRYNIVGNSDGLNRALDVALKVAPIDLSVLIIGESGVGKEIIPRVIHDLSPRRNKKYFAINCGSIPEGTIDSELFGHEKGAFTGAIGESEGYFGAADQGTIFLDEVGELPLATQARLLRVLETGEYIRVGGTQIRKTDVRIVAATNVNVQKAITERRFREDLYYRLNTIPIQMPPLRDRGRDIILLFKFFAQQMAERNKMPKITLTPEAERLLLNYKWPGNVRQLKNITEQMSVLSEKREIDLDTLQRYIPQDPESMQLAILGSNNGQHSYENDREMLFKFLHEVKANISSLHRDMNAIRQQINDVRDINGAQGFANAPYITQTSDEQTAPNAMVPVAPMPAIQPSARHNTIEEAVAEEISEPENLNLDKVQRQMLVKALERNKGNRKKAAAELGISDRTLYRRIKEYGIES